MGHAPLNGSLLLYICHLKFSQKIFYIRGSVYRDSSLTKSNEMQQYVDIYLPLNYSTRLGRPSHPSSGEHKIVFAASGTDPAIREASFFKRAKLLYMFRASIVPIISST